MSKRCERRCMSVCLDLKGRLMHVSMEHLSDTSVPFLACFHANHLETAYLCFKFHARIGC